MDISTAHVILSYMEDHLRNKDRIDREWEALSRQETEPPASIQLGSASEDVKKNRRHDVVPYDPTRAVLNASNNCTGSDYINASLIVDDDPQYPVYVAAQSPVYESVADFWQLVWEQGSAALVLLSDSSDVAGSKVAYWPSDVSRRLYRIYEVRLISEHSCSQSYCVRSFYVRNVRTDETRTVTQFHFQEWPEDNVPASVDAFLEFRRQVCFCKDVYQGLSSWLGNFSTQLESESQQVISGANFTSNSALQVILFDMIERHNKRAGTMGHSDGVGRTGTFCLIDLVLNRLARGAREIDIAATLEHLRDQRPLMVRCKVQFEFALALIALEINDVVKSVCN